MKFRKHIDDFKEYGWGGLWTKIDNRLSAPLIKFKIKKIISKAKKNNQKSILIINGSPKCVSEVHRIFHFEDKLKILKIPFFTITNNMLNKFTTDALTNFDLLYIHRSNEKDKIINFVKKYHQLNKIVIYDIDDLIFDVDKISEIYFVQKKDNNFIHKFTNDAALHLEVMKKVDLVTTPTDFLANYINQKFHIKTSVLRNHLDRKSLNNGRNIYHQAIKNNSHQVVVGYFPGTKTHQKDFSTVEKILINLLNKYPKLKLKIVGELSLNKFPIKYQNQIIKQKKVPYQKMMSTYKDVDINIAPLEMNNNFSEGKSELKYFFAGACGIPTVASATDAFKHAIKHQSNGYLCYQSNDWKKYITELIENKTKRLQLGKAVFEQVNQEYTPEFQASQLKKILKNINFL